MRSLPAALTRLIIVGQEEGREGLSELDTLRSTVNLRQLFDSLTEDQLDVLETTFPEFDTLEVRDKLSFLNDVILSWMRPIILCVILSYFSILLQDFAVARVKKILYRMSPGSGAEVPFTPEALRAAYEYTATVCRPSF